MKMNSAQSDEPTSQKPLRLWPGVVAVALQWLVWLVAPVVVPGGVPIGMIGGLLGGLAALVWWMFFSRAPWSERLGAIALMIVGVVATSRLVHQSIANGMMGMMLPVYAVPVLSLTLVSWAAASRRLSTGSRRASLVAAILLACGVFTLVRTGGISGEGASDLHWRWTPTPEERLLAQDRDRPAAPAPPPAAKPPVEPPAARAGEGASAAPSAPPAVKAPEKRREAQANNEPATPPPAPVEAATGADWPGFRGAARDGIVPGVRIATDWARSPPVQLWRRPVGPG